jgi:acid phosphatase class B
MMQLVESRGKMVVFDIDDLLVTTRLRLQKYISDLRVDFDKAQETYESGDYYEWDSVIDYAVETVNLFRDMGYKIAYLTGRRVSGFDSTYEFLTEAGFPVNKDYLFMKENRTVKTPIHKNRVFMELMDQGWDIRYYFDDNKANLEVAVELGIPNIYSSIGYFFGILSDLDESEIYNLF